MKRINITSLLVLLAVYGCTQTDVEGDKIPPHALQDLDVGFDLNVLANQTPVTRSLTFTANGTIETDTLATGVNDTIRTKAAAPLTEAQETAIDNLWVGQYDAATGQCLFNQYLPSIVGTTVNLKLKQSQDGSRSRVYFVSNAGDLGAISDEMTLKGHRLDYVSTDAGLPDNNLCRMMGAWEGVVSENGVKDIPVSLTRLLAKITFTYSIPTDAGFAFTPTSVVLRNVPTVSQVEPPADQLPDIQYRAYTTTGNTGTIYCYLPENMAGTAVGDAAVDSEKKKTGRGVTNATCIELTGIAVQGGVTYTDVIFRFYPGSNHNNYDVVRNSHYRMNIVLLGIDVSDERITVGNIPPVEVDPSELPAEKGGKKEVRITARPGQEWKLDMPVWLSALLEGKEFASGAIISHQGPAKVEFTTEESNPKAERRSVSFDIDVNVDETDQEITITQRGSTLTKGGDVSLGAATGSEGASGFTATQGLKWSAALDGDWLGWSETNLSTSGNEAPAEAQMLTVKATASNPFAVKRNGAIIVKAGASVDDAAYEGLKQIITVGQTGSTVTGSTIDVAAEEAGYESSFTATRGLDWSCVTSGNWITLISGASGSPTTGSPQTVAFDVKVNPSSAARAGEITIRSGDVVAGPTGKIAITQRASSLIAPGSAATLGVAKDAGGTLAFTGTAGLDITVTPPSWITLTGVVPATTTGREQTVGYKANVANLNSTARAAGYISLKVGSMTKAVSVGQSGSTFTVSKTELLLEKTATSGSIQVNGTNGLPWTVSPSGTTNGITPAIKSSTATGSGQTLTFNATENTAAARSATFTIAVTGGNHSKTVEVKQAVGFSVISVTIDQTVLGLYKDRLGSNMAKYPPFDAYGTNNYHGCIVDESAGAMRGSYAIQIQKEQRTSSGSNPQVAAYCSGLNEDGLSGWRLPTLIEGYAIFLNRGEIEGSPGVDAFVGSCWTAAVYNKSREMCTINYLNGGILNLSNAMMYRVRCVRDI